MTPRDLTPFPVDPEILARIRPLRRKDVGAVVALHHQAMGTSLWARLGPIFLAELYCSMLAHPNFRGFVYEEEEQVRGFIAGTSDGPRMFRNLALKRGHRLLVAMIPGLVRKPVLAFRLARTFGYFRHSNPGEHPAIQAESLFCSFAPQLRGKRISGLINKVLFDDMAGLGHEQIKITSEADNMGAFRQLTSWGFEVTGRFRFYGKEMLSWRMDLVANERVEPVCRYLPEENTKCR
jgi:hypothetical protein